MTIPRECWFLPRPRKNKYKGGFPLHFEKKLIRSLGCEGKSILHPFGGAAEFGDRVDINPETNPTFVGDAHNLSMIADNTYDLVICDPPYNNDLSKELYNAGVIKYGKYISEAVRVCKPGGFIASYHWVLTPRPEGCTFYRIFVILTRVWHKPRVCAVFQKEQDRTN